MQKQSYSKEKPIKPPPITPRVRQRWPMLLPALAILLTGCGATLQPCSCPTVPNPPPITKPSVDYSLNAGNDIRAWRERLTKEPQK